MFTFKFLQPIKMRMLPFIPWLAAFIVGMIPGFVGQAIAQSPAQTVGENKDELLLTLITFVVAPSILFLLKAWTEHNTQTLSSGWGRAAILEEKYTAQLIKDRDDLSAAAKDRELQISKLQELLRQNDNEVVMLKAENARFKRQLRREGLLTEDGLDHHPPA